MPRYGKKAEEKIGRVMHEFKQGELRSSSGQKVKSRAQAVAIGISEAREAGAKVPERPADQTAAKPAAKRTRSPRRSSR